MHIKKIISQHRRDFKAVYKCEHCEAEHEEYGYDDSHFHNNVIPGRACKECGKKATDANRPLAPRHPDGVTV